MRPIVALALVVVLGTVPAHAQWVVFDPANVAQAILIVERTMRQYAQLREQYRVVEAMSQRLPGGMDRYRTPPILPSDHDPTRYTYGAPLLAALMHGDPRGDLYRTVVHPLPAMSPMIHHLPPDAQRVLQNQYAHVEISDSIAQRAIHQKASVAGFASAGLEVAIDALERDTLEPRTAYHYLTAVLDKLTGSEMIARRQTTAENQVLSHALELLILRTKRDRDAEAAVMAMRLTAIADRGAAGSGIIAGSALALSRWRQP